jgi:cytochrome P450
VDLIIVYPQSFIQVLYRLLSNPKYIEPLRQEVEAVVAEEGWTKAAMDKLHKVDSFLKETQRVDGLATGSLGSLPKYEQLMSAPSFSAVVMSRIALRPFTFSNGVTIPAGTLVSIPASAVHTDENIYPNPDEFDGFRFAKLRESEGDSATSRYQAISSSTEHLAFGVGKHTW